MGKNFRETLDAQLKNPEFKAEWDATEAEFSVIKSIITARQARNITQKQLAEITGISQADISRLENGNANPSLSTLQKIASGLGMRVKVEFVPAANR